MKTRLPGRPRRAIPGPAALTEEVPPRHVERARIVLLTAAGVGTLSIMRQVGCAKATAWRWQERFVAEGLDGLLRDRSRPPGKAPLPKAVVERVVDLTLAEPPGEATYWDRPVDGRSGRHLAALGAADLGGAQLAGAPRHALRGRAGRLSTPARGPRREG